MNEEIPHERSGPEERRVEVVEDTVLLLRTHIGLLAPEVEALALSLPQGEQGRCLALASVAEARRKLRAGAPPGIGPVYRAEQLARMCRALIHHWEELAVQSRAIRETPRGVHRILKLQPASAESSNHSTAEAIMTVKFLGIIPNTPTDESPTIWIHEESGDLLIQSYKATELEVRACQEIGSIPGHSTDVPDHETIIRLPAVMLKYIPHPDRNGEEASAATGT